MTKPWYRSKWFRIGGVVLLGVLVVAAAIPLLVPADRFRPLLVQFIESCTGRRIQIDVLRLHLLPTVHLRAVNLRVKNPDGLPAGDMVVAKSVDLGVAPIALLSRKMVVTYVAVNGVRVNLLRDLAGKTNYDLAFPECGGASFLSLGRIGAVTIRNVEVAFSTYDQRRRQATPLFTFSGLDARIQNIRPDAPDWTTILELTSDLRGVEFSTPALTKPVQIRKGEFTIKDGTRSGNHCGIAGRHARGRHGHGSSP